MRNRNGLIDKKSPRGRGLGGGALQKCSIPGGLQGVQGVSQLLLVGVLPLENEGVVYVYQRQLVNSAALYDFDNLGFRLVVRFCLMDIAENALDKSLGLFPEFEKIILKRVHRVASGSRIEGRFCADVRDIDVNDMLSHGINLGVGVCLYPEGKDY
jgi:hypothetical protein